jgi:hypothetical protein
LTFLFVVLLLADERHEPQGRPHGGVGREWCVLPAMARTRRASPASRKSYRILLPISCNSTIAEDEENHKQQSIGSKLHEALMMALWE